MDLQSLAVTLIVTVALVYASWTLMPAAWRRALQQRLTGRVQPEAAGCGGCGGGCTPPPQRSASAAAEAKPITLHRRPMR
ncbi:hypothetical protein AACH10_00015 [Ideonella sp. DXS22W]|uniref:FeoB-associated Cys-rich membrane protein n=1 Tax=Pseudaquabacterium inlustre TaxID=2984192 RepID=A0ABU9CA30_9BURK